MENSEEISRNQNEGSSTLHSGGDYLELVLRGYDRENSPPPILPRRSLKPHCPPNPGSTGKPRALPPLSAIDKDSILNACDESNHCPGIQHPPPPLPIKSYNKKMLVDKAVQCSSKEDIIQDVNGNVPPVFYLEDQQSQVVKADGFVVVSTPATIILTPCNATMQTIVFAPQASDLNSSVATSAPRTIVVQSKVDPVPSIITTSELETVRSPGNNQNLVLESLAPSTLSRSQSRSCANEYVGDPAVTRKKSYSKKVSISKKLQQDAGHGLSGLNEAIKDNNRSFCQKCLRCKCNQCKNNVRRELTGNFQSSSSSKRKKERSEDTIKNVLVSLADDGKLVSAVDDIAHESDEEDERKCCCRWPLSFLLQCFSSSCCPRNHHNCCAMLRTTTDGCRCEEGENEDDEDEVFLT